jgi:tetratricopeptide (TPR) repeat protein
MFENAVSIDPNFALAHAGIASVCAQYHFQFERAKSWMDRAKLAADRASARGQSAPEVFLAQAWVSYGDGKFDEALAFARKAIHINPDIESGYYLLGRLLFAAGRYQEVSEIAEEALSHTGENYNTFIPILNALGALGKTEVSRNMSHRLVDFMEAHLKKVPEDARARVLLAGNYAVLDRPEDALREATLAMTLRPDDALIMYNIACVFGGLHRKEDALNAMRKAWEAGYRDSQWARQDPSLGLLLGDPEFDRLYPPSQ